MATHDPSKKRRLAPDVAELLAGLRRELDAAAAEQLRHVIATVAPDRALLRPPVALAEMRAGKEERQIRPGDLFFANGPAGQIDFVAIRDERIPALQIVAAGPADPAGSMPAGWCGFRLVLQKLSSGPWPDQLRLHMAAGPTAAFVQELFLRGACLARRGADWEPLGLIPSMAEQAEALFPAATLGCPGRSLLAAWFHLPSAFAAFDVTGLARAGGDSEHLELLFRVRDADVVGNLPEDAFRLGCIPLVNRRTETVHVTLENTSTLAALPIAAGQAVAGIGRVQLYRGEGDYGECRPWLGTRYPWRHKVAVSARYLLQRGVGLQPPSIGLVDSGLDWNAPDAHQLHVEVFQADAQAHALAAGAAVTGNARLQGKLVASPSPLLLPAAIQPAELAAETAAAGWLAHTPEGDVTEALRIVLERAATGLTTPSGGRPAGLDAALCQVDGLRRATTRIGPVRDGFCGTEVRIELAAEQFPDRAPFLFAAALERALGFFARPLTYTRLIVAFETGEIAWSPRLPAAPGRSAAHWPQVRFAAN